MQDASDDLRRLPWWLLPMSGGGQSMRSSWVLTPDCCSCYVLLYMADDE